MTIAARTALAAALLLAACGDSATNDSGTGPTEAPRTYDFSAFEAEVDAFIADTEAVDGVGAIIVHRDDGVIFNGTLQDYARQIFTTDQDDQDVIPPDTQFRYGGAQWQVAGAVAEIVSGKSWAQLIEETYVEPCALTAPGYNNHFIQLTAEDGNPFGYPAGFDGDPRTLQPSDNPNMEGGAYISIGDYGELLLMHLRGGLCGDDRVLSEAAVRQVHADRIAEAYGPAGAGFPGYGMGWWVDRDNPSVTSDPGAYGSTAWIDEDRGYGAFLVIEVTSVLGGVLVGRTGGLINQAIDAAG